MKKLSFINKIVFFLNTVFALVTIVSFVVPYVSVSFIPALSTISLIVPPLVYINIAFVLYWIVKRKKCFMLSLVLLVLWYLILGPFYLFSGTEEGENPKKAVSIMSFNVRSFNMNGQLPIKNVDSLIIDLVEKENPDIVCFQECHFAMKRSKALAKYKHRFVDFIYGKHSGKVIQAIFSKHPILAIDSINFPSSSNNAIYADMLLGKDTVRLYNIHLQSFRIIPEIDVIKKEKSSKLFGRLRRTMYKQSEQARLIRQNMDETDFKKIVVGDFNNTQYSNVYRKIKEGLTDTFLEKGKGFGKTYDLNGFPMRIDYILADSDFKVVSHKNFTNKLSDHYPVMATLDLGSDE